MKNYLVLDELRTGDIIFSTTNDVISNAIKTATSSQYSHSSIYIRPGIIIESNDDGVLPRRVQPLGVNTQGQLLGLPYDNWINVQVLRFPLFSEEEWAFSIERTLREHVGLDYPPPSQVMRGGPLGARIAAFPFAKVYELIQWIKNRETVAHDAWCSKLIGYILAAHLGHRLTPKQQGILSSASPQQLFDISLEVGYLPLKNSTDVEDANQIEKFELTRGNYLTGQDATFLRWQELSTRQRKKIRDEEGFRTLRSLRKTTKFVVVLLFFGLVSIAAYEYDRRSKTAPVVLSSYARLFGVFQVPAIMTGIVTDRPGSIKSKIFINDYTETRAAWAKSHLASARFALGPVGDQMSSIYRQYAAAPKDLTNPLYFLGATHSGLTQRDYKYLETWTFQQSKEDVDAVELDALLRGVPIQDGRQRIEADIEDRFTQSFMRVGYLFLTLELKLGTLPPDSLEVEYMHANADSKISVLSKTADSISPDHAVLSEVRRITLTAPSNSSAILLPLAMFISDKNGLPERFAGSVILPTTLVITHNGRNTRIPIAKPTLASDARIMLPIGWFHQ
jgi:hypothetical protein